MLMRACAVQDFDQATATCAHEVWVEQPAFIPPMSVAQGLQLSGLMIGVVAAAWCLKFLRRYISPKTG